MSRKVLDSNVGEADAETILDNIIAQNPQLNAQIEKVHNETNVYLCKILRIYPYEDKALVKIINNNKNVFCRLSHEILCEGMSLDYLPDGIEKVDNQYYTNKKYIKPFNELYGIVIKVRWENLDDENVLLGYVNLHDDVNLKSSSDTGELSINSGSSTISVDNERINIMTPALFINGLPYDEPELKNYYDKTEITNITNNIGGSSDIYEELIEAIGNYKTTSNDEYYLFRGDCWTVNNNFESSAAITSETNTDLTVTGTFRTENDMIGLYWYSKDPITHPYITYGERSDYTDVVLEFDYKMSGCRDFYDYANNHPVSITIVTNSGAVYYVTMRRFITEGQNGVNHFRLDFNNLTAQVGNQYINENGEVITFEQGDNLKVPVSDIKYILFVIVPSNFEENNIEYTVMNNVDFKCKITNIQVTNGHICNEHKFLKPHQYRLCEGYDDFYDLNPKRITHEMRKLGYSEWCDLYIGASHFYEKKGIVGDKIQVKKLVEDEETHESYYVEYFGHERTGKMELITGVPLNKAFRAWLDCYSRELKKNDCPNLVVSVSMENLQCPEDWRQKQYAPSPKTSIVENPKGFAMTGWTPSTFFYSPCHEDILPYMQSVSEACLDIVVANNMSPILQLGEAWWWWNEYTDPTNRSPCFYDEKTKEKYKREFGKDIPIYKTPDEDFDAETIDWLNKQIVNYSWGLREVVKKSKYENGLYTALFFPPSVVDTDRVPEMMRRVNYLSGIYSPKQLDILQLEDYDWVTGISEETKLRDRSHHPEIYEIGQKLGFTENKIHYFGGFVQYPEDASEYWREIKKAMNTAIEKGFAEVYVWAGSQVRRDGKMLGYDAYEVVQGLLGYTNQTKI